MKFDRFRIAMTREFTSFDLAHSSATAGRVIANGRENNAKVAPVTAGVSALRIPLQTSLASIAAAFGAADAGHRWSSRG